MFRCKTNWRLGICAPVFFDTDCPVPKTPSAFHPPAQRNTFRRASAIQIVRPLESIAETQPKLKPDLLRLSAMISQCFICCAIRL